MTGSEQIAVPGRAAGVELVGKLGVDDPALVTEPECRRHGEHGDEVEVEEVRERDESGRSVFHRRVDDLPANPRRGQLEPVTQDEHGLDQAIVDGVHEGGGREAREREEHALHRARRPCRRAEPRAERRSPERVVEHRGAEEVPPVDEDVEAVVEPLGLGLVHEVEDVLGEGEPEADCGSVDHSGGHTLEDREPEPPPDPADRPDRGEKGEPLGTLLHERGSDRVAEDVARVGREHRLHGAVPGERDQRGAGRAPPRHQREQAERLAFVDVDEPDQQQDDDGLDDRVADVEARLLRTSSVAPGWKLERKPSRGGLG